MNDEKDVYEKMDKIIDAIDKHMKRLDNIDLNIKKVLDKISNGIPDAVEITYVEAEPLIQCDL